MPKRTADFTHHVWEAADRIRVCAADGVGRTTFATSLDFPVVPMTADSSCKTKAAHFPTLTLKENP